MSEEPDPAAVDVAANVALIPVAVGKWPFLFVVALEDIAAGTSLALTSGHCMPVRCSLATGFPAHAAGQFQAHHDQSCDQRTSSHLPCDKLYPKSKP